jgi:DNA-directed RNA polymerase
MKRPSEDLLNEFYELAELKEENRLLAVKRFLENKVTKLVKKLKDFKTFYF